MNKLLLALLVLSFSVAAQANAPKRVSGEHGEPDSDSCGLGWQVTKNKTFLGTTTRGTTNAFVPPTFGMTSGTMGCVQHPFAKKDQPAAAFAMANYETLAVEMAEGRGEFLDGFAHALGCSNPAAFGKMTQEQYKIIMGGRSSPVRMFENVKQQIRLNANLAKGCA